MKIYNNTLASLLKYTGILLLVLMGIDASAQSQTLITHNFNSVCSLPGGWRIENVGGGCTWRCDYGGFTQNNHSSQGCSGAANDWLILPKESFSRYVNEIFNISVTKQYSGGSLTLRFSSNYPGTGNPDSYSWTQLYSFGGSFNSNINISSLTQDGYLALRYTSSGSGNGQAARWTVNRITVSGEPALLVDSLEISNIASTQSKFDANVITSGGQTIVERGFVWDTVANPVVTDTNAVKVLVSGGVGKFNTTASGLPSGKKIYVKGFVSTANETAYTSEKSFYTLSDEPTAYPTSFTAATQSKNSIKLDWTQVNSAQGYLIIARPYAISTASPNDASEYSVPQTIGNGEVVAVVPSGSTTTVTVNNLIQGTRYHFTLFPFGYDGANEGTYNYRTNPVVPTATDSTLGNPPSNKSILVGVKGSEAVAISSIDNNFISDTTHGTQSWKLELRDGGMALNDTDDLPTIISGITLQKGAYNTVSNWLQTIYTAVLLNDSTGDILAYGIPSSDEIEFTGFSVKAADNNYYPLRVKITLQAKAHKDRDTFQFAVKTTTVETNSPLTSSQLDNFTSVTDSSKNLIGIVATRLAFDNQPPSTVESGLALSSPLLIEARDTFGGLDIDFTGTVNINATGNNLIAAPRAITAVGGIAQFDTVRFNKAFTNDTIVASTSSIQDVRSSKFNVVNSDESDIIAATAFNHPQNIKHTDYLDTNAITVGNSLEVFSMWVRDGGEDGDSDFEPTILDQLVVDVENAYLLNKIALYAGSKKLAETNTFTPSGQYELAVLNGFDTTVNDDDSIKLSLRVTFKPQANDGDQLQFTVYTAQDVDSLSKFANANAGGAASSIAGDDNRVDVKASKLMFVKQPTDVTRGTVMQPEVSVMPIDSVGNVDLAGRVITLSVNGSNFAFNAKTTAASTPITQTAEFKHLIFSNTATDVFLIARSGSLDSATSDSFDVLIPTWYRSVKSGNWSDITVWETSTDYGINWVAAIEKPDFDKHGQITISAGDSVQMDGATTAENTVDEVVVEKGAVLITPNIAGTYLTVNNSLADDIEVFGTLLHSNGQSLTGVDFTNGASIAVRKNGAIEMNTYGDAINWAGNANIYFDDSAYYIHNTTSQNTISAGVMFPNAILGETPIFLIKNNYTFPGSSINPNATLTINGLLMVEANKTFTINGTADRMIRNGIAGSGNVVIGESAVTKITGEATLSGTGNIQITAANAQLMIAASSHTTLLNNKQIVNTTGKPFTIAGKLDAGTNQITGSTAITMANGGTLVTAHANGVDGTFAATGTKTYEDLANYIFNGSAAQQTGDINGNSANKVWIDNSNGVTLTTPLHVKDSLYLGNGNVVSSAANLLTVNEAVNGYSANSYVDGPLRIWTKANASHVFPVGKATYGEVTFHSTTANNGWATVEYTANTPHTDGFDTTKKGVQIASVRANDYWTIDADAAVKGRVEVPYTSATNLLSADKLNVRVVSWSGSEWQSEGPVKRDATLAKVTSNTLQNYTAFTVGIDSTCTIPSLPTFAQGGACSGGATTLTANTNGTLRWFTSMTDEVPFATGNNATAANIVNDTNFYVEAKDIGCITNRIVYAVKINPTPIAPVVTGNAPLCYDEAATLTSAVTGDVNWYDNANATTPVFTGNTFATAQLKRDTIFFVENVLNGCESQRTQVNITIRADIQEPFANTVEVCEGTPATINATSNESVRWFATLTSTTPVFMGEKFTTGAITSDSIFYAEAYDGACKSTRKLVSVDVKAIPQTPVLTDDAVCAGNSTTLNATGTNVQWYNDSLSTIAVATGASFSTPALVNTRKFYATSFDGQCYSYKGVAQVTVYDNPSIPTITLPTATGANQLVSIQTNTTAQNYEWDFGSDATPQTAVGQGPHNVLWSTKGMKTVTLKIWNGNATVQCEADAQASISIGPGLSTNNIELEPASVYPNPANNALHVKLGGAEKAQITVMDATGRKVLERNDYISESTIAIGQWAAGVYFINIVTEGRLQTVKVVKQ